MGLSLTIVRRSRTVVGLTDDLLRGTAKSYQINHVYTLHRRCSLAYLTQVPAQSIINRATQFNANAVEYAKRGVLW